MRESGVYILLFLSAFKVVQNLPDTKPPRILHEEELFASENATLICEGDKNITWTFKYLDEEKKVEGHINSYSNGTYISKLLLGSHNHQGHYYCHYENDSFTDDTASAGTYVYLYSNYEEFAGIQSSPGEIPVKGNVGEEVVLDCRPTLPNLTVVVTHKEEQIHVGPLEDPRMGFVLQNLTKEDRGIYVCNIQEEMKKFDVTVREPPRRPWLNISTNTYPVVGYDLELHCRILDDIYTLQPTFDWIQPMRDNRTRVRTERHRLKSNTFYTSYLRIKNVTMDDSGTYSCNVRVEGRHPIGKSINIKVKETMESFINIVNMTQNITCSKGDNATWDLRVESYPPMPIFQRSNRVIHEPFENGTNRLTIANVTPSDFGEHRVSITTRNNPDGIKTVNVSIYLEVESDTELSITGINLITAKNATTTAICNATGYPLQNITWYYQPCPKGECPDSFRAPKDANITHMMHQENHYSSEYTFVAKELARIKCRSGSTNKTTNIIISDFMKPYSFKLNGTSDIKDLQRNSSYNSIETDSIHLTCAASRFFFNELSLTFSLQDQGVSLEDDEKIIQADTSTDLDLIKTIYVANVSSSHKGNYACFASAKRGYESKLLTLDHKVDDLIAVHLTGSGNMLKEDYKVPQKVRAAFTFNCSVSGTQIINVTWTKDDQPLPIDFGEFKENNQVITISDFKPKVHSGHYKCEARNRGGSVRGYLTLIEYDEGHSTAFKVTLGVSAPFFICLLGVIIVLVIRVRRDIIHRREMRKNRAFLFERGCPNELNPDCTVDEQAELLPYDNKWEVSRDQIQLGQQLGAGAFGRVVKATVSNLEPWTPKSTVALKMSKTHADPAQIRALTQELKIMIHIGKHLNIVNLLGAYTSNLSKGELWILVEYCRHGCLLPFLHRHRQNFKNVIDPTTDLVNLSGEDGESISPFSPVPANSPTLPRSSVSAKFPNGPQSPTRSEKECYESAQTATSTICSGRASRQLETSLESPTSPTIPFSPTKSPSEDSTSGKRHKSPPRIFKFGDSLPKGMKMVQNPSYQAVPVAENAAELEEESRGQRGSARDQSLKVVNSQGNYFMYDKSTIPGVTSSFTTIDLLCWSWQVAEGMDYLTRRKILHGDLAVRNLLLTEDNVVKISDFGLSRDIYMEDIYMKKTNDLLPVKWMSVEAIRDRIFSIQSDIWSFGVTMWELFSLGSTPYPGVKIDHTFLQSLQDGYRMEKPEYANTEIYKTMCQCWEINPHDRPSFRYLADRLSQMLMPETTQHYNNRNGEYLNMNEERFKHEKDYLEMLASPDIRNITRDGVSQCEDTLEGPIEVNQGLQIDVEKAQFPLDQETGYLLMSSVGTPESSINIFSPKSTLENEDVFTFDEEAQSNRFNPSRQSYPNRGNPSHHEIQQLHLSFGDFPTTEELINSHVEDKPSNSPELTPQNEIVQESSCSPTLTEEHKIPTMSQRPFSQGSNYINVPLAPETSPPPSPEITIKMPIVGEVNYANLQTVR